MSNFIDSVGQANQGPPSTPGPATRQGLESSNYRGQSITRSHDPIGELEDAAEELTFGQSERVEDKLSKRKIKGRAGLKTFAMEQAEKYLKQVPDLERNKKLSDFVKTVLGEGAQATPEKLRQGAREFSSDATHQFLALSYAHEQAKIEHADPKLLSALEQTIEQLQAEEAPAIQAGLNVSTVANSFSESGLSDTQQLRDLYRDVVLDYGTVQEAYTKVVAQYEDRKFPEAVNFLLKSLSADLGASTHSISKVRLKQIMDDMYQLKSLNSMYDECQALLDRVRHRYVAVPESVGTHDLMKELLTAQDRGWQGEGVFTALPGKLGISGSEPGIYFLQGFKEVVRLVPLKVFNSDPVKRERLLQSVQQSLDTLIDNEYADE